MQDKHFSPSYVPDAGRFVKTSYCGKGGDTNDFSLFGHIEYVENALGVSLVQG